MDAFIIEGGNPLQGEVTISGAKNAVLGIIPAAVLCACSSKIENVPDIKDVNKMIVILEKLGAEIYRENDTLIINTEKPISYDVSDYEEETGQMRASYYLLGALLGRYRKAIVPLPGGCNIGDRPIDQHIKGFQALGATVVIEHGQVKMDAPNLKGAHIFLDVVSVGATINIMLAAVRADGKTIIENAAKEPHIVDVANFLNLMGANIKGAGTDVIKIVGVSEMHGCEYSVIPDQITTGTYMMAAAATEGDVLIKNVIPKHMEAITAKLNEMGVVVLEEDNGIRVRSKHPLKAVNVKTMPYPGFPTDLQQPMAVLMTIAEGISTITESIFESRFKYVDELRRMGANISINSRTASITGVKNLSATKIRTTDLRAGAAMVIAGLIADGETKITEIVHIDRGYENLQENLRNLGADIRRVSEKDVSGC
ncbi:UDP-N-acetylglucosamine 1-carboxyvinyltransferase [Acetobacterium woodii]|uniref:UDP-N-acetylglucosamine 1-carboxyvinyltransferase n=1 Tax=Acetobacterium woodii (strain ATCC 29683 / DSM 1030 / JCM 2381 / KCTC 1655 / WB1) TaxID=931626 RepID=H6LKH3_ACEWD|nr:UDP-N-acetylglucosamine 1-carboxyvinyltransferase [Acetobacterium woodii]AFA47563.1 UDP-N-acetylglucosamine 1-carboxyvinyltransferase MurA [Acetobacterium woodii DSM 1030]